MANKLAVFVTAEELIEAGAPKSAVRQSFRKNDAYVEVAGEAPQDTAYEAVGSAMQNHIYAIPAKKSATVFATKIVSVTKIVWGGSLKDSYALVTEA